MTYWCKQPKQYTTYTPALNHLLLRRRYRSASAPLSAEVTLSNTLTENLVVRGSQEITIKLRLITFVSGSAFIAAIQDLIDGITSNLSGSTGWNEQVRDRLRPPDITRVSASVVRIRLPTSGGYRISVAETISILIPASILSTPQAVLAGPVFVVSVDSKVGTQVVNTNATDGFTNYEICERTGFRVLPGTLVEEWTGTMVRPESYEPKHPQIMIRSRAEKLKGSIRPEQADRFITTAIDPATDL